MTTNKILFNKLEPSLFFSAKKFQKITIDQVKDLEYAALFFEQGLGKTKMAIDIMSHWYQMNKIDTVIIFTKKILVDNWKDELKKHTNLEPAIINSDKKSNHYLLNSPHRLFLANFESLNTEYKKFDNLSKLRRVGVILDESAKIKNPEAVLTKRFFEYSFQTVRRLILTGTPVANRPFDIWSQVYFLDHGYSLGDSFKNFKKAVDIPKEDLSSDMIRNYTQVLSTIFPRLENFCFRETKESSGIELPSITKEDVICSWEPRQYEMYDNVINEIEMSVIKNGVTEYDISEEIAKKLLRLIQVSSNPSLIDEGYSAENGKYQKLKELLNTIPQDEKIIIWTNFVDNVNWIYKKTKSLSFQAAYIHGRISIDERNYQKNKFINESDVRILIANPAAAKEGLTLTCANHAIYYDRTFALDDYLQSQARIHRISQNKSCKIYHLIMDGSIDEWVDTYLKLKELGAKLAQGDISEEQFEEEAPRNIKSQLLELLNHG